MSDCSMKANESTADFKKAVQQIIPEALENLKRLIRIPSISFENFEQDKVLESAQETEQLLKSIGATSIQRLIPKSGRPSIFAELKSAPENPTILLYAHHDVQPPMREALWETPPFEPAIRGDRLYGRGAADDKAGIVIHAMAAQLAKKYFSSKMPNLKFLIEGEEECGSSGFYELLKTHRDLLSADAVIVADLGNFAKGEPSITTTLRGMSAIEIELSATKVPLHSGSWSGPIPDPAQELCKIIASLTNARGDILIENFTEGLIVPTRAEQESYASLGMSEEKFRAESGMLPTTKLLVSENELCESLWRRPSIVVTAMESGSRTQAGNVLQNSAYARIGIRLAPGMDSKQATQKLIQHIQSHVSHGLTLHIKEEDGAEPFVTDTTHPYFQYMQKAMSDAFATKSKCIGCGASIPAAEYFRQIFGDIPILLIGVEDPECNAHGENESLYLPDFEKTLLSEFLFFKELGTL